MTAQVMIHCKICKRNTMHLQPSTSHVLHLLLTLISFGFWLPIWALVAWNNRTQQACTVCGNRRGLFGS